MGRSSSSTRNQATSASPRAADRGSHRGSAARSGVRATMAALCQAVETNDLYTRGHSQRVLRARSLSARRSACGLAGCRRSLRRDAARCGQARGAHHPRAAEGRPRRAAGSLRMRRFHSERHTGTGRRRPGYSRTGPKSLPPRGHGRAALRQHAARPNMELPPKPQKDNYQHPERRLGACYP